MINRYNDKLGVVELLVDARNFDSMLPQVIERITEGCYFGFDIETEDSRRHEGHNRFMKVDPTSEKYKKPKHLVFDLQRTDITGFSLYVHQDDVAFYFNTGHADVENRIPLEDILPLLYTLKQRGTWVIHNVPFEMTMLMKCWDFDIGERYVDTLALCVSAYSPDEVNPADMDLGGIQNVFAEAIDAYRGWEQGEALNSKQNEVIGKVCAKESIAAHSWNGVVRSKAFGYGLKQASKYWLKYEQDTFENTLNGKAHMGLLTGEEVLHYGADDAVVCMRLMVEVLNHMKKTNPALIDTFFKQENPMQRVFSQMWGHGVRIDHEAVTERYEQEKVNFAAALRDLKRYMRVLIAETNWDQRPMVTRMANKEANWYPKETGKNCYAYREAIIHFAYRSDGTDAEMIDQVGGPMAEDMAEQRGEKINAAWKRDRINIAYYRVHRMLFHDLMDLDFVWSKGKIISDAEARGKLKERLNESDDPMKQTKLSLIGVLDTIASIDTRIKLYLKPYQCLIDPDTGKMHPSFSAKLATRRMSCVNPNAQQLAKRGESTYVRGFFLPDNDDHVLMAYDFSAIELCVIGEYSKDPEFYKAYGQIPHKDLHAGAAASAIRVWHPAFTNEDFQYIKTTPASEWQERWPRIMVNPVTKEPFADNKAAAKWWRGTAGKGSSFGFWFSGSLNTLQEKMGWTQDETFQASNNYRETYPVAEEWRKGVQEQAKFDGYAELPDKHRRSRWEATLNWQTWFITQFDNTGSPELAHFGRECAKRIHKRALNQIVNFKVQGLAAAIMKEAILNIREALPLAGVEARLAMAIHDEVVYSVNRNQVIEFDRVIREAMQKTSFMHVMKLDVTGAVGLSFEPWHPKKAPLGQVEIDEVNYVEGVIPEAEVNGRMSEDTLRRVVDHLFATREALREAV